MGKVQDDVMHDWNNTYSTTRQSFTWMKPKLQFMYLEYLDWLKNVFHQPKTTIDIFTKEHLGYLGMEK
jgi:transposase InsO family protein